MSAIPSWARPGVEVVCVMDFRTARHVHDKGIRTLPEVGSIHVVEFAEEWPEYDAVVLHLLDFPGQALDIKGFQPVTKRTQEQDIAEHFSHLLKVDAPEGADA